MVSPEWVAGLLLLLIVVILPVPRTRQLTAKVLSVRWFGWWSLQSWPWFGHSSARNSLSALGSASPRFES